MPTNKPLIGISQCLTDSIVRYDAKSQFNSKLCQCLEQPFELIPICPEVECGLGMPRPPIELVESQQGIRVVGRDNKQLDVTEKLAHYTQEKVCLLSNLSGYVFKSRSPSCGVGSTPIFDQDGKNTKYSNGFFVEAMKQLYPNLPMVDDSFLDEREVLNKFVAKVFEYSLSSSQQ